MSEKAVSVWLFPGVGAAIVLLLILSFVLSYVDSGGWAVPIAIVIASVQALLVAWFSMELFESRFSVRMLAVIAPLFVVLLTVLAAADIATRTAQPILVPIPERGGLPGTHPKPFHGVPGPPVKVPQDATPSE